MSLKKALATLLATGMMLSLVSCGSKSNEEAPGDASKPTESAESSGKIKVGFSSAAFSDEWCHNLALTFENLTATEYPEIEVTVLDGNIDAEKQINTIQSLMQQGMDYIVVQPLPGTEPALQEVVDAGVPLFCVDTVPTSDTLVWTQVGVDEAEFGRLQAEKLAEVLPENGTVCIAMNQLGTNSQINRTRGFTQPSGTEWLETGATYVDVFYDYNALAKGVYDTILDHEKNGTDLPAQVMINPSVWTKENASEFGK